MFRRKNALNSSGLSYRVLNLTSNTNTESALKHVLKKKTKHNVKVHILNYKNKTSLTKTSQNVTRTK